MPFSVASMADAPARNAVPGHTWYAEGQSALTGAALALMRRLDGLFLDLAAACGAEDHVFPPFLPAAALDRIDYFESFPHLATFPVNLERSDANLKKFSCAAVGADDRVQLTGIEAPAQVLTPSACYHFYRLFEGHRFDKPVYVTTQTQCFRREDHYVPLERQWAFAMREIVCIGTASEVEEFLAAYRQRVSALLERLGVAASWERATDPFFNPTGNSKYVMQQLLPIKHELVFDGRLAIGSVNFHHDHFGRAFDMRRGGEPLHSGCVAFGVERWVAAIVQQFGADPAGWPRA
jgi:seryl-tRNA synthetase